MRQEAGMRQAGMDELELKLQEQYRHFVSRDPVGGHISTLITDGVLTEQEGLRVLVVELSRQRDEFLEQVLRMQALAPRRMLVGDEVFRYDAPDHLIPIEPEVW